MNAYPGRSPSADLIARAFLTAAIVTLAIGIVARVWGLDQRPFFADESFSALRISAHSSSAIDGLFDGRIRPAAGLKALQHIDPKRGVHETIAMIASEEPQRSPIYYAVLRAWAGRFGDSLLALRAASVAIGIAGIGLAFLATRELGGTNLAGMVGAALYAISPIQVHYSQQVREYGALSAVTLLTLWLLTSALDRDGPLRWTAFSVSVAIGLYVSIEFLFVIAGFTLSIICLRVERGRRRSFFLATAAAVAAYLPWLAAVAPHFSTAAKQVDWVDVPYSAKALGLRWIFNLGASFFDSEFARLRLGVVLAPILAIVAYTALRMMSPSVPARTRWLVWAATLSAAAPLAAIDLIRHGHFEAITRYLMSTWAGLTVLVALGLAFDASNASGRRKVVAFCAFLILIAAGVYSAFDAPRHAIWWDDNDHFSAALVGARIAAQHKPLVVTESRGPRGGYLLSLGRYLPDDATLLLYKNDLGTIPKGAYVFVFLPTANDLAELRAQGYALKNVSPPLDFRVPELRSDNDISAGNTLWTVWRRGDSNS